MDRRRGRGGQGGSAGAYGAYWWGSGGDNGVRGSPRQEWRFRGSNGLAFSGPGLTGNRETVEKRSSSFGASGWWRLPAWAAITASLPPMGLAVRSGRAWRLANRPAADRSRRARLSALLGDQHSGDPFEAVHLGDADGLAAARW